MGVAVGFRGGIPLVEREGVGAFGQFDTDRVVGTFAGIVLYEFSAEAASLDTDHGIDGGIEVGWAAELFRSNLVFLYRGAGMLDRVVREITQELTK
jgi:hypothetical protein